MNENENLETLKKILQLTEENNKILHRIRFEQNLSKIFTLLKILLIVIPILTFYFYAKPYLAKIDTLYQKSQKIDSYSPENIFNDLKRDIQIRLK